MSEHRRARAPLVLTGLAIALVASVLFTRCGPQERTVVHVGNAKVSATVARSNSEHQRGLQGEPRPAYGEGMLFVWGDSLPRSFSIKSLDYDLDVIWISADGRVVGVDRLSPNGPTDVTSPGPVEYVLEVPAGWASSAGVSKGSPVQVELTR